MTPQRRHRVVLAQCATLVLVSMLLGRAATGAEQLDLRPYRGRVVVVDFWASWCGPCRQSFPWLNEMQARYAERGLTVIGVNVDAKRADAERFLRRVPAKFSLFYDPDGAIAQQYKLEGMPASYVYGPDGTLLSTHIGFTDAQREQREAELVDALGRRPVGLHTREEER
ncbi:MAG: TlpA disulfide reductase family protein [Steroidobacteraceae bacterium]